MISHARLSPALTNFLAAIDRVEAILDQEAAVLRSLSGDALKELSDRKARSLVEISRAARGLGEADTASAQARLEQLRDKLDQNRSTLLLHLNAARDIAALVSRAVAEADSDGTYTAGVGRRSSR